MGAQAGLTLNGDTGGAVDNNFHWADNGAGGVNYYNNGAPITREAFQSGVTGMGDTQTNVGNIENWVSQNYAAQHPATGPVTAGSTGGTGGSFYSTVQNPAYTDYMNQINSMGGLLQQQQDAATGQVNNNYGTSQLGINNDFATGNENLANSRNQVDQNKAKSLRDLSTSLQNSFTQGQNQLGNAGAGDSSAVDQYAYALAKMQNQSRGDLMQQANQQYANLDMAGNQLGRQHDQQLSALDTWKSNALLGISSQYAQQRAQLEQLKLSAPAQYSQQLQQLNSTALSHLQAVDQAMQAQGSQFNGGLQPATSGLDLQGTQVTPGNLSVQPINGGINYLQPTANMNSLQSASPVNALQGSTGTARVKQPWEY